MKRLFTILFLALSAVGYGQTVKIDTVKWLTEDLGGLSFVKGRIMINFDGVKKTKAYQFDKDTLIIRDEYIVTQANKRIKQIDQFKFLILNANERTLKIKPVNANARSIASRKFYTFHNLNYLHDADIRFDKVSFTSGPCVGGSCPVLHVDVDAAGNYNLSGQTDAVRSGGPVKGILSAADLAKLNFILQHSRLKEMQGWKQKHAVRDAPAYTITVTLNKKDLTVFTNVPTLNMQPLIDFLLTFEQRLPLIRK